MKNKNGYFSVVNIGIEPPKVVAGLTTKLTFNEAETLAKKLETETGQEHSIGNHEDFLKDLERDGDYIDTDGTIRSASIETNLNKNWMS